METQEHESEVNLLLHCIAVHVLSMYIVHRGGTLDIKEINGINAVLNALVKEKNPTMFCDVLVQWYTDFCTDSIHCTSTN